MDFDAISQKKLTILIWLILFLPMTIGCALISRFTPQKTITPSPIPESTLEIKVPLTPTQKPKSGQTNKTYKITILNKSLRCIFLGDRIVRKATKSCSRPSCRAGGHPLFFDFSAVSRVAAISWLRISLAAGSGEKLRDEQGP